MLQTVVAGKPALDAVWREKRFETRRNGPSEGVRTRRSVGSLRPGPKLRAVVRGVLYGINVSCVKAKVAAMGALLVT